MPELAGWLFYCFLATPCPLTIIAGDHPAEGQRQQPVPGPCQEAVDLRSCFPDICARCTEPPVLLDTSGSRTMNSMTMAPIHFQVWSRTGGAESMYAALFRSTSLLCPLMFNSFSPWRFPHVQLYAPVRIVPRHLGLRIVMLPLLPSYIRSVSSLFATIPITMHQ